MNVYLPIKSFSFFKVALGLFFLLVILVLPHAAPLLLALGMPLARAHSLGAWISMWRAKKLNWRYAAWIVVISSIVYYLGFFVMTFRELLLCTGTLFMFHFLYDEFDLQEQKRTLSVAISGLAPLLLSIMFLVQGFTHTDIHLFVYLLLAIVFSGIELLVVQEINWFFVQTKIITVFVLCSVVLFATTTRSMLHILLMYHYLFWFIFPVYKLHKYKPEERDGFIMILLFIVSMYIFSFIQNPSETAVRAFYIVTIIHIFSTAPFGYLFGLPRPTAYAKI